MPGQAGWLVRTSLTLRRCASFGGGAWFEKEGFLRLLDLKDVLLRRKDALLHIDLNPSTDDPAIRRLLQVEDVVQCTVHRWLIRQHIVRVLK